MTYRTCVDCVFGDGHCAERQHVRERVSGLGVTSIKWRCKWKRLRFRPGDPVWATTADFQTSDPEDGEPILADYPGVVIQTYGPKKVLVWIEPGALPRSGDNYPFEPRGNGHCKIPLARIRKRDGIRQNVCHDCRRLTAKGHDNYCMSVYFGGLPGAAQKRPARSAER